jgi:hypothetical protein
MQLPPAPCAFFQFSTGPTLEPLAKTVGMTDWCSRQDLSATTAAEPSVPPADSGEVREMWPHH